MTEKITSSWDAIVVTCKTRLLCDSVRRELLLRQKIDILPRDVILLCVEDPQEGLGSGGASLNALLVVTEHLSARNKLTIVSTDILKDTRILIVHLGRHFCYDPCGRAFASLPVASTNGEMKHVLTSFDALYNLVSKQFNTKSPPGVWICSSDMILQLPLEADIEIDSDNVWKGVCCISVPADVHYARKHGVYKVDNKNSVCDIIFKGTEQQIRSCSISEDQVALVSGIVFFSSEAAGKMLSLHTWSPVDACTYMGLDNGEEPIQISLYFDILLCMAEDIGYEDFVHGKRSSSFGHAKSVKSHRNNMEMVRKILWDCLRNTSIKAISVKSGKHQYLSIDDTPQTYTQILKTPSYVAHPHYSATRFCFSHLKRNLTISNGCIINSIVGENVEVDDGAFIAHSHLEGNFKIGRNSVIIGIDESSSKNIVTDIPPNSFILGCNITLAGVGNKKVFCVLWDCDKRTFCDDVRSIVSDDIGNEHSSLISRNALLHFAADDARPLPTSYQNTLNEAIEEPYRKVLLTAKLYPILHPTDIISIGDSLQLLKEELTELEYRKWKESWRMSLDDILEHTDYKLEFQHRRNLSVLVACEKLKHHLSENLNVDLQPLYVLGVASKQHAMILSALDEAALECISNGKPHLCARVFSCIAEVLAMVAGSEVGLRSGPAANREWRDSLLLLNTRQFSDGVVALSKVRQKWMANADSLIRSARHYERASQIFIRLASASVATFIRTFSCPMLEKDAWVVCESPARIDLSGGWSDTPPVCYENGGAVLNVALLIDGKRPVGARVRRISEPVIKFSALDSSSKITAPAITWSSLQQFHDYCQPQVPGALIKACIVMTEIIVLDSPKSLKAQLLEKYGGGLEVHSWSSLPRGSGMGTSSILAGTVIMALYQAVGRLADVSSVIHAVVMVEQMLTTGGGWQDQVGGLVGGVKICRSEAKLPLEVIVEPINVSDEFFDYLDKRMKMIYTGSTRLARNVLQEVLRNWYAKKTEIIATCKELVKTTYKCREAFINGDSVALGECMNAYWKQKKVMAPGCEPFYCTKIMEKLESRVLGQHLAGAGGGGFCVALFKDPITNDELIHILKQIEGASDVAIYDAKIDRIGATIYKEAVSDRCKLGKQ